MFSDEHWLSLCVLFLQYLHYWEAASPGAENANEICGDSAFAGGRQTQRTHEPAAGQSHHHQRTAGQSPSKEREHPKVSGTSANTQNKFRKPCRYRWRVESSSPVRASTFNNSIHKAHVSSGTEQATPLTSHHTFVQPPTFTSMDWNEWNAFVNLCMLKVNAKI